MTATTDRRWINTADVAKLIRPALKKAFPAVKFSVRSRGYAGGSSIDVTWTDGPTTQQVDAVTKVYEGNRFDGMDDLQYHADQWLCPEHGASVARTYGSGDDRSGEVDPRCCEHAESVRFGVGYVQTQRRYSPEFRAELEAAVSRETGLPYDANTYVERWQAWMSQLVERRLWETAR